MTESKNSSKETYLFIDDYNNNTFICEATSFADAIKQFAEYEGAATPLFLKSMKGMETNDDMIELFNHFSSDGLKLACKINSIIYDNDRYR